MNCMPNYGDSIKPIFSVIVINIITLGFCSVLSIFFLKDILLGSLFLIQIYFANQNQGFICGKYLYHWRIADIIGALSIGTIVLLKYYKLIPNVLKIPLILTLIISSYSQSNAKSIEDYIFLVNIWHILVLDLIILLSYLTSLKKHHRIKKSRRKNKAADSKTKSKKTRSKRKKKKRCKKF